MPPSGRVLSVNVSPGGVPKIPIAEAWVDRLGLASDGHNARTVHGGPHRAVCLYSIEAIERLQAEGHPIEPGSVGENLTTAGIEWSLLPVGTRARVGTDLVLELADSTTPCSTQRHNFRDGRFSRISIELHPSDSRMYARVLHAGLVRAGDSVEILPPAPDSRAAEELLLARLEWAAGRSALAGWRVARELGHDVRIVDDGELLMAAAPSLPGPRWSQALGLARMPNLLPDATRFFTDNAVAGWLVTESAPWPDAQPAQVLGVFRAHPAAIEEAEPVAGMSIRPMTADDLPGWWAAWHSAAGTPESGPVLEVSLGARALEAPHHFRLIAELDGQPVGTAALSVTHRTGWLRGAMVVPAARGRGIQRALIAARAALAAEQGCDLVGAWAEVGTASEANLEKSGLDRIGTREFHRYVAATAAAAR